MIGFFPNETHLDLFGNAKKLTYSLQQIVYKPIWQKKLCLVLIFSPQAYSLFYYLITYFSDVIPSKVW